MLESPAKIDVVAGFAIFGIEAADIFESPAPERHVTAGNMLGHGIGKEDVAGAARGGRDTGLDPLLGGRSDVGASRPGKVVADQCADQVIKPVDVGHAVGIGVGKYFAFGRGRAGVTGMAETVVSLVDVTNTRKFRRDLGRIVGRAVIDQDDFVIRIIQFA